LVKKLRGKSGQRRGRQLLTATEGNLRESATETKPLCCPKNNKVRVKRVGQEPTVYIGDVVKR